MLITSKAHQIASAYEALWGRFPEQMNNLAKLKSLSQIENKIYENIAKSQ